MNGANLFDQIPAHLPEELIEVLADSGQVRIERILSRGHASAEGFWYDQPRHEFVVLLQGEAELELLDPAEQKVLHSGDWLEIPAHRRHRVVRTSCEPECIWLAVFYH